MNNPISAALLSCKSTSLSDDEKYILSKANPLGITLFARNISNKQQTINLIKEIKETIGRDNILICVDQEGGRVRRLHEPEFRPYSAQADIGKLPLNEAIIAAKLHAELIAQDLQEIGINVNFAPVLDIAYSQTSEALRSRCFSNDLSTISTLGNTMIQTYTDNGIIPCIKHMPGHGLPTTDPHLGLPIIDITYERLKTELQPFKYCKNSPLGMTAHILLPVIDPHNPITQSKKGIQKLIREDIGFDGLLISDAIDMKALKGNVIEKALASLDAGCDCICYCMANIDELSLLAEHCPKLSDAATEHLDKALTILHNKKEISDIKTKSAQYASIMQKIIPYKETYDATEVLHKLQKKETQC